MVLASSTRIISANKLSGDLMMIKTINEDQNDDVDDDDEEGVQIRVGHAPLFSDAHRCESRRISAYLRIFAHLCANMRIIHIILYLPQPHGQA